MMDFLQHNRSINICNLILSMLKLNQEILQNNQNKSDTNLVLEKIDQFIESKILMHLAEVVISSVESTGRGDKNDIY